MPDLWIPGANAEAIIDEKAGVDEAKRVFGDFRNRLQALDSRLDILMMTHDLKNEWSDTLRAGFYYIFRNNEDGTKTYWQVCDPKGNYSEPTEAHIEAMRRIDSSGQGETKYDRQRRFEERKARIRKREEERKRQLREGLLERAKFNHDTPSRPKLHKLDPPKAAA